MHSIDHLPPDVRFYLFELAKQYKNPYLSLKERQGFVLDFAKCFPREFAATMVYLKAAISDTDQRLADPTALLAAIRQKAEDLSDELRKEAA